MITLVVNSAKRLVCTGFFFRFTVGQESEGLFILTMKSQQKRNGGKYAEWLNLFPAMPDPNDFISVITSESLYFYTQSKSET